jgi:hypothetical protein
LKINEPRNTQRKAKIEKRRKIVKNKLSKNRRKITKKYGLKKQENSRGQMSEYLSG